MKPSLNHCELPAVSVKALAIHPPVQDSAVATQLCAFNNRRPTRAASNFNFSSLCAIADILSPIANSAGIPLRKRPAPPRS
jgi:hypothetical protein